MKRFKPAQKILFWGLVLLAGVAGLRPLLNACQSPAGAPEALDTFEPEDTMPLHPVPERTLEYPSVGTVMLYGNFDTPQQVVLFLSGDGGWDKVATDLATALAQDGKDLIVGVDLVKYYDKLHQRSGNCLYPAGDMENLSEFAQKQLHFNEYHKPVLAGYSAGATLVYALLCQAPTGTFQGGVVLGFCPEVETGKPFCEGSGHLTMKPRKDGKGFDFDDRPAPAVPLEVLHGDQDQVCDAKIAGDFFNGMPNVRVTMLSKVGHGFARKESWLPQFRKSFNRLIQNISGVNVAGSQDKSDLPLNFTEAASDDSTPLVLFLSGDGGWTGFDQEICNGLAEKHWPCVGLNAQRYFWKKKTPEQTVADLAPVIRQYLQQWGRKKWVIVGYSFGADVAPFICNHLPQDLSKTLSGLALLSPDTKGDFEIHVSGMMGFSGGAYDVAGAVKQLNPAIPVLCVRGATEENSMQEALPESGAVHWVQIPGSHHYNNDAKHVANTILSNQN